MFLTVSCAEESGSGVGTSSTAEYDGTYDWNITVHGVTASCSQCVTILRGAISNLDSSFYKVAFDSFGNITITSSKCPNGNPAVATYTGTKGGISRPQWQGTWTCADGTSGKDTETFKLYNAQ